MPTYGSVPNTQALIRHMAIDAARNPSTAQLDGWLTEASALLTSYLADAGYATPVAQQDAKTVLDSFANVYAAARAELAQRFAGDTGDEGNKRYEAFLAEWEKAAAWAASGAPAALGVPQLIIGINAAQQPTIGRIVVGTSLETARTLPLEWR